MPAHLQRNNGAGFRILPILVFKCIFIRYAQVYLGLIFFDYVILKKFSRLWKLLKLYLRFIPKHPHLNDKG